MDIGSLYGRGHAVLHLIVQSFFMNKVTIIVIWKIWCPQTNNGEFEHQFTWRSGIFSSVLKFTDISRALGSGFENFEK